MEKRDSIAHCRGFIYQYRSFGCSCGKQEEKKQSVKLELPVKSAILMEQKTGKILYTENAEEKMPPASVTKIMTLLLVMGGN